MHLVLRAAALAALVLTTGSPAFAADKAPKPSAGLLDTFKGCQWGEVKGAMVLIASIEKAAA